MASPESVSTASVSTASTPASTATTLTIPSMSPIDNSNMPKTVQEENYIRTARKSDVKQIAETLLSAFEHDHVMRYFIDTPDAANHTEETKLRRLHKLLELTTAFHISYGTVTTIGDNHASVALWLPPNPDTHLTFPFFKSFWRLRYILTKEGRTRFFNEFSPLLCKTKAEVLEKDEPDAWYLVYLATKPSAQGRGYGRMLLNQMADDADRNGRKIYLESSNEANLRFYGRSGFVKAREIYLERDEHEKVALDILVRSPKSVNTV